MHPRADHKSSVDASLQAGKGGACFGDQPSATNASALEAEGQQVGGEAVTTGERELARRLGGLDVEARKADPFASGRGPDSSVSSQASSRAGPRPRADANDPSTTRSSAVQVAFRSAPTSIGSSST
jgi:hypothetical protein